jgi:GNAT superfamily N-acetyltransferase
VSLRRAGPADESFLRALDGEIITERLGAGWLNADQLGPLVALQLAARGRDRAIRFPDADQQLIVLGEDRVGGLLIDRSPDRFLIVDIAVIAAARGRGVGAAILATVSASADDAGCPVRATARDENVASRRLFAAAGFVEVGDDGVNVSVERPVGGRPPGER